MTTQRYFSLGRFAMRDALRYAEVKPGDGVLLPSFICRDLLSAVAELGAKTHFYDVDQALKPIHLDSTTKPKVIVAVNYFGFAQDLKIFREFAAKTGAIIIEDNAHGYLSRDDENQLLGHRERFGVTSFRKTLHVKDGAILTTSLRENEIDNQLTYIDSQSLGRDKLLHLLSSFESRTNVPAVAVFRFFSRLFRLITTGSKLPQSDKFAETKIPGIPNPLRQSVEFLQNLDESAEVARRRNLYQILGPQVVAAGARLIFDSLPANTCPYGLPVYAAPNIKRKLEKIARKNRVTLMCWPDLPNDVRLAAPNFYQQVWLL
ncbi:MAG: DegT/DnrJ/EryC1/StrS family aminotransferase, partial [Acidimicrobiaceae bacterium]